MNLAVDVGNTLIKLGVFDSGKLKEKETGSKVDFLDIVEKLSKVHPTISNCIISSVSELSKDQLSALERQFEVLVLDHQTEVPFKNKYRTPQTLGIDRIALVSAAALQYAGKNVLIIDAGTCITYDFITAGKDYLGGAISPGISLRYKSLYAFTDKLPFLKADHPDSFIGNSTEASIHSGVIRGILHEIDGFIDAYKQKYNNLTIILTGGDLHFLQDSLKNDIFANSNFLLEGLDHILEYNKH